MKPWIGVVHFGVGETAWHNVWPLFALFFNGFISPLFNQVGQLRTSSHLQLRPGQDKANQGDTNMLCERLCCTQIDLLCPVSVSESL